MGYFNLWRHQTVLGPTAGGWLLIALFLLMRPMSVKAALNIEIIGSGETQTPIAVVPFAGESALPQQVSRIVAADLQRSGLFKLISTDGVSPLPHQLGEVKFPDWVARGAEALVIGAISRRADGQLTVQFRLLDPIRQTQLAGFSYTAVPAQLRYVAHRIADVIYQKLTGTPGVFGTRIAYVLKVGQRYALRVADADGYNARTVLASREPIISPAWSPDGTQLAYVSFEHDRPMVYVQTLATGRRRALAAFKGNNSAPAWSPNGKQLAVVLTLSGHSQIYIINVNGSGLHRLTHSQSIDTEPNWSPDGQTILFTSDRGGSPQIYRIPAAGGHAVRLTFDGNYNVTPRYSPDGRSFTFIHRMNGQFHTAIQEIANGQLQVLTQTPLDESPSFAPNGKMVLYATDVNGRGVLAAVSSDGRANYRLTVQYGDVREPAWGPYLNNQ